MLRGWDADGFAALTRFLTAVQPMIALHAQQHLAHPAPHGSHSADAATALPARLAAPDEALHLLRHDVGPAHRPHDAALRPVAKAIATALDTLSSAHIEPAAAPPPAPSLDRLSTAAVPTVPDAEYRDAIAHLAPRRRLAAGLAASDGRAWEQVADG